MIWLAEKLLASSFGRAVLFVLGAIAALGVALARARRAGARDRDARIEVERLRADVETRRRIDRADTGTGDAANDREWLLRRGRRAD